MSNILRQVPFKDVVIIADLISSTPNTPIHLRRDLEQTDNITLQSIINTIVGLGLRVTHYENPKELACNASKHLDDVVLSIYGGSVSRNRMALVPAVCEVFGLPYVGPDAYARIICQDKEVSKSVAREAGLMVAQHRIVREHSDLKYVAEFPLPWVAKPLWEGSSIGIVSENLVKDKNNVEIVLKRLLDNFAQPIMLETFIPGREVSWCFIEANKSIGFRSFAEVIWKGDFGHFDEHLYDAEHKSADYSPAIRLINNELKNSDTSALERLIKAVGPLSYGRIDGKFHNGRFIFLEITPDAWLGKEGTFISSFIENGMPFEDVIAHILLSARPVPPDRSTSDLSILDDI